MQPTFIALSSANIADFAPLYFRVFNAPPWNDGWASVAEVDKRLQIFAAFPSFLGLGLLIAGEPVGFAFGWGEHWVSGPSFFIKEYCVATERQRTGLGRALFDELARRLNAAGYTGTYLQTDPDSAAEAFYSRMGFQRMDLITMGRGLHEPA
jgi:ribosomal protein S18 acetylase RimI-like enzyme